MKNAHEELIEYLSQFATSERFELFQEKIRHRTRHFAIVIENLFQEHNTSAVLRTADCFGFQDVHIIENDKKYKINNEIALGASKWLNINHYNQEAENTANCLAALKSAGYKIAATTPHQNGITLDEINIDDKTALVFGTELEGISPTAIEMADIYVKVPMMGFTESLNISVCAGICMHHIRYKMKQSGKDFSLSETERNSIMLEWLRNSIKNSDKIEEEYYKRKL